MLSSFPFPWMSSRWSRSMEQLRKAENIPGSPVLSQFVMINGEMPIIQE